MDALDQVKLINNATPLQLELRLIRKFCKADDLNVAGQVSLMATYLKVRVLSLSANIRGVSDPRSEARMLRWYNENDYLSASSDQMDIFILRWWLNDIFTPETSEDRTSFLVHRMKFFTKHRFNIDKLRISKVEDWSSPKELRDTLFDAVSLFVDEFHPALLPLSPEDRLARRKKLAEERANQAREIMMLKIAVTQLAELFINYTPELKDPVDNILKRLNQ